jgi:uncharacterized protein (UPF0332 family)
MNVRREGIELWPRGGSKRVAEEKGEYQGEGNDDLQLVLLRAHEALDDSQLGLGESRHGWAANRAYYAMFHAATALLLSEGLAFSRHRGVIGAFHERYIKTGKLPRALGTHLDDAFVARNKADYAYREEVGAGEAGSSSRRPSSSPLPSSSSASQASPPRRRFASVLWCVARRQYARGGERCVSRGRLR